MILVVLFLLLGLSLVALRKNEEQATWISEWERQRERAKRKTMTVSDKIKSCLAPNCVLMAELCEWNYCGACCAKAHLNPTHVKAPPLSGEVKTRPEPDDKGKLPAYYGGSYNWGKQEPPAPILGALEEIGTSEELLPGDNLGKK